MFIDIQNVSKSFKSLQAVNKVSLQIPQGLFLALLGPNGAGKTTLVEMIEGIQTPDSGSISIAGKTWQHHAKEIRNILGICLQETQYMEKVTVSETIRLFAEIYQTPMSEIQALITQFGLTEAQKQYVLNLSGGQRQKLSLLLSLINHPAILILDEPTTGLDPHFRREIWELLLAYKAKGLTLILTTHYMEEADILCDRIVMLNKGQIIRDGTKNELLQTLDAKHKIIIEIKEKELLPTLAPLFAPLEIQWQTEPGLGQIKTNDPTTVLPKLLSLLKAQNLTINNLEIKHNTLEDVFISLTGATLDA
jgi:ABC-2 type transport system ATP-binding protein